MTSSKNPYKKLADVLETELYELGIAERFDEGGYASLARQMLKGAYSASPRAIADIGCATGHSTLELSRRYPQAELIALDLNDACLEVLRHKLGLSYVDVHRFVEEGLVSSNDAERIGRFLDNSRNYWKDRKTPILVEGDAVNMISLLSTELDLVFASQLTHWIYNQGGEEKLSKLFKAIHNSLARGGEFIFSTYSQFCTPVEDVSVKKSMVEHPLHRKYIDVLVSELQKRGYNPQPKEKADMNLDRYQLLLQSAGFEIASARDILTPYPLSVFISSAYRPRAVHMGVFDGIDVPDNERNEIMDIAIERALHTYTPDPRDMEFERAIDPTFWCRKS